MVELLIGMLIGLVTTVVIAQVLVASENRRRGTSSGADAQVNGAVALYSIQRDLQGAGYGMSVGDNTFGCTIGASYNGVTKALPAYQPLRITDGVAGAPDAITLYASSKNSYTVPTRLTENFTMPPATNRVVVNTTVGISVRRHPDAGPHHCGLQVRPVHGDFHHRHDDRLCRDRHLAVERNTRDPAVRLRGLSEGINRRQPWQFRGPQLWRSE